jgi:hypothetical protein
MGWITETNVQLEDRQNGVCGEYCSCWLPLHVLLNSPCGGTMWLLVHSCHYHVSPSDGAYLVVITTPRGQGDLAYHIQIRHTGEISTTRESAQAGTNNDRGGKNGHGPRWRRGKWSGETGTTREIEAETASVMHTCCFLMLEFPPCQYQLCFPPWRYDIRTCHSLSFSCTRNIQLTYYKTPPLPKNIRVACVYVCVYVYIYICI